MKKKIRLNDIKVQSFITSLPVKDSKTIGGGKTPLLITADDLADCQPLPNTGVFGGCWSQVMVSWCCEGDYILVANHVQSDEEIKSVNIIDC